MGLMFVRACHICILARAFPARLHKVSMYIKTQTKRPPAPLDVFIEVCILRICEKYQYMCCPMGGSRGRDRRSRPPPPPPPGKSQNIGFLSNTGPDPLKKIQSNQVSMQFWAIIGTSAKRQVLNGVSLVGR